MNKLVIGKNPIPESVEEIFREQIVNKERQKLIYVILAISYINTVDMLLFLKLGMITYDQILC
jgi:hypothetical protein